MMENASTERKNQQYEAVVVGCGLGGLGAALELARKGVRVLLLEQHNLPGGFATSFVRGRFEFEPSLHQTPGNPGIGRYLREELGVAVELASVPEAYRLILSEDGIDVSVPFGVEELIRTVEACFPGSSRSLSDYLELCREVLETLNYLDRHRKDFNKRDLLGKYRNFLSTGGYTVEQVSDALALPQQVRKIIYPYWCYLGVPMSRLSFTIWAAMLYTYFSAGAMIPRQRSHGLVSALLHRFEELGGRALFNRRVVEIQTEKGSIRGVRTASGELIATTSLICNLSPTLVFNRLVTPRAEVPAAALRTVNARRHGVSTFVVYLGLNAAKEQLGLKEYSYFISANMDTDEIYRSTGRLDAPTMQASVCLNNAVPDCSPPGTTILSLTACFRPEAWHGLAGRDYFRVKREIAGAMIRQFERAVNVSIRPHIVPRVQALEKESYLEGLRFCGGFDYRCHGYGSSLFSGRAAARRALATMGGGL
jgi:phytoene dehydrogenase-like protein